MRLYTAEFSRKGALKVKEGMSPFESQAEDGSLFNHLLIGRLNRDRYYTRVGLGEQITKGLVKTYEPCPNDGKDTLGICQLCGLDITPERIEKVVDYRMANGIDVWKNTARHTPMEFLDPIMKGAFMLTKVKKTLLLIEDQAKTKDRRIGLLLYVEPGFLGTSSIEPVIKTQSPILAEIHKRAAGQRWLSRNPKDGVGVERLMILSPGDYIFVSQDGQLNPKSSEIGLAAHKIVVLPNGVFDVKKVEATPRVEPPAPKEKKPVAQAKAVEVPEPSEVPAPPAPVVDEIAEGAKG